MKGANRYMKILSVFFFFFEKKNHLGQFELFSLQAIKQSGHDFFHDYCWILKQSGHD